MCDIYYRDMHKAMEGVEGLDLSFLSDNYQEPIENLLQESDSMAEAYKEKFERVEELEGIVENLRELIEDNEE